MTLKERFQAVEGEYLEFDRIPYSEQRHSCRDLCGLLYVAEKFCTPKYSSGADKPAIDGAEHDIVYFSWGKNELEGITDEDVLYLMRCGINYGFNSLYLST